MTNDWRVGVEVWYNSAMEKFFNIAGPCIPGEHYMLPALDRLPDVRRLVDRNQYFVLHAPRQTGKTTAIKALVREINAKGDKVALYCTLETLQNAIDPDDTSRTIANLIIENYIADICGGDGEKLQRDRAAVGMADAKFAVRSALRSLCRFAGKPLVVFFDEVDCLFGQSLILFIRQLRDGYVNRDTVPFPASVALVGMLDVRDYKAQVRADGESLEQISPFNIISKDLLLRNFTAEEVRALYAQHTDETGQTFAPDAITAAFRLSCGQPWLVNALARECVEEIHGFRYDEPITAEDVETAKETIIRRRDTHVDSLMERLRAPRIRRIVEPVILGDPSPISRDSEDYRFVTDLGLLKDDGRGGLVPANPMYSEIIGRYLTRDEQDDMKVSVPHIPWGTPDGLDMPGLMAAFQTFWRENSEADRHVHDYKEATPHLVLMAFLQRVVNGGGRITREMALGSGRLDLCVEYRGHRYALELKLRRNFSHEKSLAQFVGYLDHLGLGEGWMPIFDDDKSKSWDERLFNRDEMVNGKVIHVVGV